MTCSTSAVIDSQGLTAGLCTQAFQILQWRGAAAAGAAAAAGSAAERGGMDGQGRDLLATLTCACFMSSTAHVQLPVPLLLPDTLPAHHQPVTNLPPSAIPPLILTHTLPAEHHRRVWRNLPNEAAATHAITRHSAAACGRCSGGAGVGGVTGPWGSCSWSRPSLGAGRGAGCAAHAGGAGCGQQRGVMVASGRWCNSCREEGTLTDRGGSTALACLRGTKYLARAP
jgi:hypothetical protein